MAESYNICLDIGGTKTLGAVFDSAGNIVFRLKKKTKSAGGSSQNVEELIISVVEELIDKSGISKKSLHAIAAGAPGVINQGSGIVLFSPNLPWRDYDIATPMKKKFGVPFYIGNDVNVGVLGEYKYGAAQGCDYVVGLFIGTGMGGGLILDGKLYTGRDFKGAEIGHMVVNPDGPLCGCGQRGCLEALSSKKGMTAYMREQIARGRSTMVELEPEGGTFRSKSLKKALRAHDVVAMEAVERSCHYLAIATGSLINIFSPDVVVFGGGIMESMGDLFLEKIAASVGRYCMPSIGTTVQLKKAALGDDSIIYGALSMITEA